MAFNFGTPAGSSTPSFSFGGASTPAFGAAATPSLAKTSSTPLFGTPAGTGTSSSLFGANTTPAFSFSTPTTQPAAAPSLFGAPQAAAAPTATPAFSFSSPFGTAPPQQQQQQQQPSTSFFGQPQQQQQQQQSLVPLGGFSGAPTAAAAAPPDDSALKELQSIKDSYIPGAGNHRHRFQYLFLNVVDNPAARVKPADVDELQWREAVRRAGGVENNDRLWPVQAQGFKGLLARKAAQDEAIKEHSERLQALQQAVASLAARHEAVLRSQFESVKKRHAQLCQQLLHILRYVDALEGRYAHAMGYRSSSVRATLQSLSHQLSSIESSVAPGSTGGLQSKIDALVAAARLRAGAAAGPPLVEMESGIDPSSLHSAYAILSEYAEALSKMHAVLRRNQREMAVLDDLSSSNANGMSMA